MLNVQMRSIFLNHQFFEHGAVARVVDATHVQM